MVSIDVSVIFIIFVVGVGTGVAYGKIGAAIRNIVVAGTSGARRADSTTSRGGMPVCTTFSAESDEEGLFELVTGPANVDSGLGDEEFKRLRM